MKLGLGLSIPGIAAMGGKQVQRLYSEAVFRLDARFNPDQATGVPTDLSADGLPVSSFGGVGWVAGSHWTFDGVNDYFEAADNDLFDFGAGDSFTLVAVFTQTGTAAATLISKRTTTGNTPGLNVGWVLQSVGGTTIAQYRGDNGTTIEQDAESWTSGARSVVSVVRTPTTATVRANGVSASSGITAGSLVNSNVLRFGRLSGAGTQYSAHNFHSGLIIRRALTSAELAAIEADWA